jgi:hypothetical protein
MLIRRSDEVKWPVAGVVLRDEKIPTSRKSGETWGTRMRESGSVVSHLSKIAKGGAASAVVAQAFQSWVPPWLRRRGIRLGFPRVSTRKAFRPQFLHKRGLFLCCGGRGSDGEWLQRKRESFLSLPDDCGRACSSR